MQDLQQTLLQVLDYIRGIWIKKRYVIICSWLICPVGFIYVSTLPDVYESKAQVFVDTRSVLQPLLRGLTFQTDPQQEIQMMAKTLLSRTNVETIARESDLDITTDNEEEFDNLVRDLTKSIKLGSTARDNIYTISYENEQAALAQTVVQETLDLFVEGSLGNNRRDTDTAERFINEQIAEYEARLAEAEQRLADFKRQYSDILPLQGTFYANLQKLNSALENTRLQIKQTQQQVETLRSQLTKRSKAATNSAVEGAESPALRTRYDERIRALEEQLDQLRLRFTDFHPDVIETKSVLENLETVRQREIDAFLNESPDESSAPMSSLNQEISLEISRLESEIASLKVQEEDSVGKIAELEAKIDLVPQVEAESSSLNRDYDITKRKYEELLSRRESADLSRRADVSSEDLQFRIIEPPLLPSKPSGPARVVFFTLVLVLGFGSGIAIAFLVSQLSPILVRAKQLTVVTQYPVWGAVSHLNLTDIKKKNRNRVLVFALSSGCIIAMYVVLVAAELLNVNLLERFV